MTEAITDAELLSRAWQNECDGWLALGRVPGSPYRVDRDGPVTCAWWEGEPGAMDNYIMLADDCGTDLAHLIGSLADRMRASRSKTAIKCMSGQSAESGRETRVGSEKRRRRRGLALAVIQRQLDDAAAGGLHLASLRTVDNLVQFYGHLGFRLVGRPISLLSGRSDAQCKSQTSTVTCRN